MESVFKPPPRHHVLYEPVTQLCRQGGQRRSTSEPLPTPKAELDLQVRGTKLKVINGLGLEAPGKGFSPLSSGLTPRVGQHRKHD